MEQEKNRQRMLYQLSAVAAVLVLAIFALLLPQAPSGAKGGSTVKTLEIKLLGEDEGPLVRIDTEHKLSDTAEQRALCYTVPLCSFAEHYEVSDASVRARAEVALALEEMLSAYSMGNASYTVPLVTAGTETGGKSSPLGGGYAVSLSLLVPMGDSMTPVTLESPLAAAFYAWLVSHAPEYGFYVDAVGSLRYLGIPHATYLYQHSMTLVEYLSMLSDTTEDAPLEIKDGSRIYRVFFVSDARGSGAEISIPVGCAYTVSGTNIGGYIVTVFE